MSFSRPSTSLWEYGYQNDALQADIDDIDRRCCFGEAEEYLIHTEDHGRTDGLLNCRRKAYVPYLLHSVGFRDQHSGMKMYLLVDFQIKAERHRCRREL